MKMGGIFILVSIPSNGSIQFLQLLLSWLFFLCLSLNPLKRVNSILTEPETGILKYDPNYVSIPSNGSIQFLHNIAYEGWMAYHPWVSIPSNGSIQFLHKMLAFVKNYGFHLSQSPQTGQFNSYLHLGNGFLRLTSDCLNPLKRVNSILTYSRKGFEFFH